MTLREVVMAVVDEAPPLTNEQCEVLSQLLRESGGGARAAA
jgi:hypothetical protein